MNNYRLLFFSCCLLLTSCRSGILEEPNVFFLDRPATEWEETFPLGNGRIGLMSDGGIEQETILMNEISLWSGSKQDASNPLASQSLPKIRALLFEGKNDEAQNLMYQTFRCSGQGSAYGDGANAPYGSYQLLGNLVIDYSYPAKDSIVSDYRKELNMNEAISAISFKRNNSLYVREQFTSFTEDVGVIRLLSEEKAGLTFCIKMNRPEHATVQVAGNDLLLEGQLPDGVNATEMKGMKFAARVRVLLPKDGSVSAADSLLRVDKASEAIILVSMATDYFDKDISGNIQTRLSTAAKKDYETLKQEHINAYSKLFSRVDLNLGRSNYRKLPIDKRLSMLEQGIADNDLYALYFQFGRYLLISSTRPGLLPPNLQGLWCNTIHTPWNGDYHLNINLQMNLWPAEVTNLSELHEPFIEWTKQQVPSGERTANAFYNANGWVTHILGNVWEFTEPGEHPSWGATCTSAAWLCQHLYQHYQYTCDLSYLKEVYPVMKKAALFFTDILVRDPRSGYLVTAPTTSPENAFKLENGNVVSVCAGSTMDNQIIRELFTNTMKAAGLLHTDSAFSALLAEKMSGLMPTTIGADGRIMEWLQPYEEVEPHHRHVSHLYGLYPGDEISLERTPELAEAAKKTLLHRGDKSTGWSMAWKINFWARLHEGNYALKLLKDLLHPVDVKKRNGEGGTYPNLFCAHPPFQIDGNFGATAGVAEMLVQSHTGQIHLLPALPSEWSEGRVHGLKVRGGGEISVAWKNCELVHASLKSVVDGTFVLALPNGRKVDFYLNDRPASLPIVDDAVSVKMQAGDVLVVKYR